MISGFATSKETIKYLDEHGIINRETPWFSFSPIAIGTHLGNMDDTDSILYQESIEYGLINGINFIDTAINYRGMKSERDVGIVLTKLIENNILQRNEIVISTKAGIIPGDIDAQLVPRDYLKKILLDGEIIKVSDLNIVENHRHVLAPSYYKFAIEQSKKHLRINTIDIHYIHNPEISMEVLGDSTFYKVLEPLFLFYEEQVSMGNICFYGFATWDGLLCNPGERGYISLERVINTLKKVVGEKHHFKFIQCPYNMSFNNAKTKKNQKVNQNYLSLLEAAKELDLTVVSSAPFNLGKLVRNGGNPDNILSSNLNIKEIYSIMVGMKNVENVIKNIELIRK